MVSARCGPNSTVLLTDDGQMMAMGSNKYNKLNLAFRHGFFSKDSNVMDILSFKNNLKN